MISRHFYLKHLTVFFLPLKVRQKMYLSALGSSGDAAELLLVVCRVHYTTQEVLKRVKQVNV